MYGRLRKSWSRRTGPTICTTSGLCVPGPSCGAAPPACFVPFVWANRFENAPEATSATKTPKRQSIDAIKTRRLKKADFEVDFFFIFEAGVVSLSGEPETIVGMLREMLKECQHFFQILFCSRITLFALLT